MKDYRISYLISRNGIMRSEVDVFPCEESTQDAIDHLMRDVDDGEECRVVCVWVDCGGRWEIVDRWGDD